MTRALFTLLIPVLFCTPATAGPNSNGAIIVHTDDTYVFGEDDQCIVPMPATCDQAVTQVNTVQSAGNTIWFLAAFMPNATPDVATIYFGVNFDAANLRTNSTGKGHCGEGLEIPDAGWPSNTAGNTWGFNAAQAATLFPFYWFLVRPNTTPVPAGAYWCSGINPTGGYAAFVSSTLKTDLITQFGCVHWHEAGYNTCPQEQPATGACCSPWGVCTVLEPAACLSPNSYLGDGTVCFPDNPCPSPSACCSPDGSCNVTPAADCLAPATWHPEWTGCAPNPCPQPPIGACCSPASICTLTTQANCQSPGVWHFMWEGCSPNPCPPPTGACCVSNGACAIRPQAACPAPCAWHSGWACEPNNCPQPPALGVCCNPVTGACFLVAQLDCLSPGTWHSEWTSCNPIPCANSLSSLMILDSPNGGESWTNGSQQAIRWHSVGSHGQFVRIELLRRISETVDVYVVCRTLTSSTQNSGNYVWTAGRCGLAGASYRIQVTDLTSAASDRSDQAFSIPMNAVAHDRRSQGITLSLENPFRPDTAIGLLLPRAGDVSVEIFDVHGHRIRMLVDESTLAGVREYRWDGETDAGSPVSSGIYYLRVQFDGQELHRKLLLVR